MTRNTRLNPRTGSSRKMGSSVASADHRANRSNFGAKLSFGKAMADDFKGKGPVPSPFDHGRSRFDGNRSRPLGSRAESVIRAGYEVILRTLARPSRPPVGLADRCADAAGAAGRACGPRMVDDGA